MIVLAVKSIHKYIVEVSLFIVTTNLKYIIIYMVEGTKGIPNVASTVMETSIHSSLPLEETK